MKIENQTVVKATYELYINGEGGKEELMEQATEQAPLVWCQGEGMMLPAFEAQMAGKEAGETFDLVLAIGPGVMMKFTTLTCKPFGVPCRVSMNPIMIDGTGMCGGCRLTVGGETKFACVDGPDFDGFKVDFDEAMKRTAMYRKFERHAYEATCNLLNKEVQ